jgi:hypothetical protein
MICLDELSSDERLVADHCAQTAITIRDLSGGQTSTIQPPTAASGFSLVGGARFSPDLTRVASALAKRDPSNEQGWVAISDGLSGGSKLTVTGQPVDNGAPAPIIDQARCASPTKLRTQLTMFCKGIQRERGSICLGQSASG